MPQASDELRAEMKRRFGDSTDSEGPIAFLRSRGWALDQDWEWSKPGVTQATMPRDEFDCVLFLVHEWDFGGVKASRQGGEAFTPGSPYRGTAWRFTVSPQPSPPMPTGAPDGGSEAENPYTSQRNLSIVKVSVRNLTRQVWGVGPLTPPPAFP